MLNDRVFVKPDTRNHKGFFILEAPYKLMDIDPNGWALICLDDYVCHYVDPDCLQAAPVPAETQDQAASAQ
jgi:hypothetical protein